MLSYLGAKHEYCAVASFSSNCRPNISRPFLSSVGLMPPELSLSKNLKRISIKILILILVVVVIIVRLNYIVILIKESEDAGL